MYSELRSRVAAATAILQHLYWYIPEKVEASLRSVVDRIDCAGHVIWEGTERVYEPTIEVQVRIEL